MLSKKTFHKLISYSIIEIHKISISSFCYLVLPMKFANVLNGLKRGELITANDLFLRFGISPQLATLYLKNKLLVRLAHGVYCLPSDEITLTEAVRFLKKENLSIHLASQSALAITVIIHNIAFSSRGAILWGDALHRPPEWMKRRFGIRYSSSEIFSFEDVKLDKLTQTVCEGLPCSIVERATLELLYETGTYQSFELTGNLFDLLPRLRPNVIIKLLQSCKSLKVKRLFACFASRSGLIENVDAFFNENNISLGQGKRWQVTVGRKQRTTIGKGKRVKLGYF